MVQEASYIFIISIVFFSALFIYAIYRFISAKENREKEVYAWSMFASIGMIIAIGLGLFKHYISSVLIFIVLAIVGAFRWKKSQEFQKEIMIKSIVNAKKDDTFMPWDCLTWTGWTKLALRHGAKKAAFFLFWFNLIIIAVVFSIIRYFSSALSIMQMITYGIIFSLISTITTYKSLKEVVNR